MVQAHYIYCTLYCYYTVIYNERAMQLIMVAESDHQALDSHKDLAS